MKKVVTTSVQATIENEKKAEVLFRLNSEAYSASSCESVSETS